jgi:CHAT domain-containing protein
VIAETYPGYFKVKYDDYTPTLEEVQNTLRGNDVLLEYFWGNKSVFVLGIDKDQVIFKKVAPSDSVKRLINEFNSHFEGGGAKLDLTTFQAFAMRSHALYNTLIGPVVFLLNEKKNLRIVPDGLINLVPFETLISTRGPSYNAVNYKDLSYLLYDYTVSYTYSSTLLQHTKRSANNSPEILAMGYTSENPPSSQGNFSNLSGSSEELNLLARYFENGTFLKGKDATEDNFKRLAATSSIVHLAIHGQGDINQDYSASLFFYMMPNSSEDGELHSYELYNLKLNADLAVLSSCESGLGKGYKGEGMISMASAFAYSGCQSILFTLWKLNDSQSVYLMDSFYKYIAEGKRIDEALSNAKIDYLKNADGITANPQIWASFVGYGSMDPVVEKNYVPWIIGGGLIVLLVVLLSLRVYSRM